MKKKPAAETKPLDEQLVDAKKALAEAEEKCETDPRGLIDPLHDLAWVHIRMEEPVIAHTLLERALAICENPEPSPNNGNIGRLCNLMAIACKHLNRIQEAETYYLRALQLAEARGEAGRDEPPVAHSNLAGLYFSQNRCDEAVAHYLSSIAGLETLDDKKHLANVRLRLADVYIYRKQFDLAEALYRANLADQEEADQAETLDLLSSLYIDHDHGNGIQAEKDVRRAIELREQAFGTDHPLYAAILNRLANLLEKQERWDEAVPIHEQTLAIRRRTLAPDAVELAQSLHNLAVAYQNDHRYADAEKLFLDALKILTDSFEPVDLFIHMCADKLAGLYEKNYRFFEAEPLRRLALRLSEKNLAPNHLEYADDLEKLADTCAKLHDHEAVELMERALAIRLERWGEYSAKLSDTYAKMAALYRMADRVDDAVRMIEARIQATRKFVLRADTENFDAYISLIRLYESVNRPDLALQAVVRTIEKLREYSEGWTTPEPPKEYKRKVEAIAHLLIHQADLLENSKDFEQATALNREALELLEELHGRDSEELLQAIDNLSLLVSRTDLSSCRAHLLRALAIRERRYRPTHREIVATVKRLGVICHRLKDFTDAEKYHRRLLALQEATLGGSHRDLIATLDYLVVCCRLTDRAQEADALQARCQTIRDSQSSTS